MYPLMHKKNIQSALSFKDISQMSERFDVNSVNLTPLYVSVSRVYFQAITKEAEINMVDLPCISRLR